MRGSPVLATVLLTASLLSPCDLIHSDGRALFFSAATTSVFGDSVFISTSGSFSGTTIEPLEQEVLELSSREMAWQEFVSGLQESGSICAEQILEVRKFWRQLTNVFGISAPLPITQPTDEHAIQLAWNSSSEYLDIEFLPKNKVNWFYRNRKTGEILGTDEEPIIEIPAQIVGLIGHFRVPEA